MDFEAKIHSLEEKGVPLTAQRFAVLEYLYQNHTHPTAEEIYQSLKENFSIISQATIYNALQFLKNHGLIREITIEKGKSHFDYEVEPHHHFLCRRCGHIYDIYVEGCPLEGKETVDGYKIEELRPYIIGVCPECLSRFGENEMPQEDMVKELT